MPIHAPQNQYPGINPHLNSYLQSESGGWESLHAELVVQTRVALDAGLPPGYLAVAERSLQISELTLPTPVRRTRPDVTIYHQPPTTPTGGPTMPSAPTATLPLIETVLDEDYLSTVIIYQQDGDNPLGRPVTRIEVLSPANKPGGSHHPRYLQKRIESLRGGLSLVEVDFLHERPPIIPTLPVYPGDEDAFPYTILVSDPRPRFEDGRVQIYGFGIVDPVLAVAIPLAATDVHVLDCGAIYQDVW